MTPIALPSPSSAERTRLLSVHALRSRALERLYERHKAVDGLIHLLEDYIKYQQARPVECVDFISAERKCS
jgi:hypothetical protein